MSSKILQTRFRSLSAGVGRNLVSWPCMTSPVLSVGNLRAHCISSSLQDLKTLQTVKKAAADVYRTLASDCITRKMRVAPNSSCQKNDARIVRPIALAQHQKQQPRWNGPLAVPFLSKARRHREFYEAVRRDWSSVCPIASRCSPVCASWQRFLEINCVMRETRPVLIYLRIVVAMRGIAGTVALRNHDHCKGSRLGWGKCNFSVSDWTMCKATATTIVVSIVTNIYIFLMSHLWRAKTMFSRKTVIPVLHKNCSFWSTKCPSNGKND